MFKTFYLTAKLQKIQNVMLVELDILGRHVVFLIISIYKKKNIFFRYLFDYCRVDHRANNAITDISYRKVYYFFIAKRKIETFCIDLSFFKFGNSFLPERYIDLDRTIQILDVIIVISLNHKLLD